WATYVNLIERCDPESIEAAFCKLERSASDWFDQQGVRERGRRISRSAAVHFVDQSGSIVVGWPGIGTLEESLNRAHMELFGFVPDRQPGELLALRVEATSGQRRAPVAVFESARTVTRKNRDVYVGRTAGTVACEVYDRGSLSRDTAFGGPAVVEQMDSTTYVPPGFRCTVDGSLNLVLTHD